MNIILAEDDPVNQKITLLMLKKLGIHAEAAANGLEVVEALEKQHYDIVLMDIQMPEMDGIEATRIIRECWVCGPKIIVITDCDPNTYRELCFDAGANDFLAKPVMVEELTAAIEHNETMVKAMPICDKLPVRCPNQESLV
jgi:CheY-like chemotaxis protein